MRYFARAGNEIDAERWARLREFPDYVTVRSYRSLNGEWAEVLWIGEETRRFTFRATEVPEQTFEDKERAVAVYEDWLVTRDLGEWVSTVDGKTYLLEIGNILSNEPTQHWEDFESLETESKILSASEHYGTW